MFGGSVGIMRK